MHVTVCTFDEMSPEATGFEQHAALVTQNVGLYLVVVSFTLVCILLFHISDGTMKRFQVGHRAHEVWQVTPESAAASCRAGRPRRLVR